MEKDIVSQEDSGRKMLVTLPVLVLEIYLFRAFSYLSAFECAIPARFYIDMQLYVC